VRDASIYHNGMLRVRRHCYHIPTVGSTSSRCRGWCW